MGKAGTSLGMLIGGATVSLLRNGLQWSDIAAYRAVFIGYAAIGIVKVGLTMLLSSAVESERMQDGNGPQYEKLLQRGEQAGGEDDDSEEADDNVLEEAQQGREKPRSRVQKFLPAVTPTRNVVSMGLLLSLDAFASGLAPL